MKAKQVPTRFCTRQTADSASTPIPNFVAADLSRIPRVRDNSDSLATTEQILASMHELKTRISLIESSVVTRKFIEETFFRSNGGLASSIQSTHLPPLLPPPMEEEEEQATRALNLRDPSPEEPKTVTTGNGAGSTEARQTAPITAMTQDADLTPEEAPESELSTPRLKKWSGTSTIWKKCLAAEGVTEGEMREDSGIDDRMVKIKIKSTDDADVRTQPHFLSSKTLSRSSRSSSGEEEASIL